MTDAFDLLSREIGASRVVRDPDLLERFARDESDLGPFPPDCAVLVESAEEASLVLEVARAHRLPVTPRGTGTGMTGGALPVRGGIVLSTEKMAKVKEIDGDNLLAVVEPGVITGALQERVEEAGLFYPPDPASLDSCSIGGNVAENAGGARAFKYGVTRDYLLALEVALMGGERLRLGRRTAKGVTGYDMAGMFVGSEGTLGVATEVTLRLMPRPTAVATMIAVFPDMFVAGDAVTALLRHGHRPRCLELMDRVSCDHVRGRTPYRVPDGAGAIVIVELDGAEDEAVETEMISCADRCEAVGAVDVLVARDARERRNLWETRRRCSPMLKEQHKHKQGEDIVVPRAAIPEMLRRIDAIAARHGVVIATFGHAGDGNLHVNLVDDGDDPGWAARLEPALDDLFRDTLALGGTLSGEHGIGLSKQRFVPWEQSPALIEWQRRLKRMLDPDDLLNPGKIFP